MGQFYDTTLGIESLTKNQLDHYALECGGRVGGIGYGFATLGDVSKIICHGYRFKWINRQGMGNHGTLIMKGTTYRTRKLLFDGKVKLIADVLREVRSDIQEDTIQEAAKVMAETGRTVQYSLEYNVLKVAALAFGRHEWWYGYRGIPGGMAFARDRFDVSMSTWRLQTAHALWESVDKTVPIRLKKEMVTS